jgi:hypothetical protein
MQRYPQQQQQQVAAMATDPTFCRQHPPLRLVSESAPMLHVEEGACIAGWFVVPLSPISSTRKTAMLEQIVLYLQLTE